MTFPKRTWSIEQEQQLIELACSGMKYEAIAAELGRTHKAVISKADRLRDDQGVNIPLRNRAGRAR